MELLHNSINVYLFVEDIKEYIDVNSIKINIGEDGSPYFHNTSISIECEFNENTFENALNSLKYINFIQYNYILDPQTGRCPINKKDIVSDIILYVSKFGSNDLIKIIELKNVMITSINQFHFLISLTCDYYIRFNDFLEIEDKEYIHNICNLVNINYNRTYNPPYYLGIPFDHTHTKEINNNEEDYEEIYDDWDDYDYDNYEEDQNNNDVDNIFEKSGKLVSKIFSSFYK